MQPTPETTPTIDETDLPELVDEESDIVLESTAPPQQVFVTYWANAPHHPPTVVSISYINENGECVVLLNMINDNIRVQFRRHNNF